MHRRSVLLLGASLFSRAAGAQENATSVDRVLDGAARLRPLKAVAIAHHGKVMAQRGYKKHTVGAPTNIKSASKSVISALVGMAIDQKLLAGVDQKIAPLLEKDLPESPDPRLNQIPLAISCRCRRVSRVHPGRTTAAGSRAAIG